MGGNPKRSRWHSTPQDARVRPKAQFTLAVDVLDALDAETGRCGRSKSESVERALRHWFTLPERERDA